METDSAFRYFENTGSPAKPGFTERVLADNPFNGISANHYFASYAFADLDGDRNIELIVTNIRDYLDLYENIGVEMNPDIIKRSIDHHAILTLYDSGGNDTLDLRTAYTDQRVDLRPEKRSDAFGSLAFAPGTIIENVIGGFGNDSITGNMVANRLVGGPGSDQLWGDSGNDVLEGGAGGDRLDGGAGVDTVSYQESDDGVRVDLEAGTGMGGHAEYDVILEVENVRGSAYGDILAGDNGANRLDGAGGDDELRGRAGKDVLRGGAGADVLEGGRGDDVLEGGAGADRLDGGPGTDWLSYAGSDARVIVDLLERTASEGHAEGDVFTGIENVMGSDHNDRIMGNNGANHLDGGDGDDGLWGGNGDDLIIGGNGDDWNLDGGNGNDKILGGNGIDWMNGGDGADELWGGDGDDSLDGDSGDDRLYGGKGNDLFGGGSGDDLLEGGDGDDSLWGHAGDDVMKGGAGDDELISDAGADFLDGGPGVDTVNYWFSYEGVTVNLVEGTGGDAEGDVLTGIEIVRGSHRGDNVLVGDSSDNQLYGFGGNDELRGNDGDDYLDGDRGDDVLWGGAGNDVLDGGPGADIFIFAPGHGDDIIPRFSITNVDLIDLTAFELSGFDDLTISSAVDNLIFNVTIDLSAHGGGTILLEDYDIANLDASDFIF